MIPNQFQFLGECHHLASALNSLYGLPLCVLYGERLENQEFILIHVGVVYKGCFIDELGLHSSPEEVLANLKSINPDYDLTQIFEFDDFSSPAFQEILIKCGASFHLSQLEYFKNWIQNNPKFDFLT